MDALIATLKNKFVGSVKAIKIRKIRKDQKRFGLLDSGATNNVREAKKKENYKGLIPIEVEVAFDSEVKAELFVNPYGTVVGSEGTETIVSMNELVKAGYELAWKGKLVVTKDGEVFPVEVRGGAPALPHEICLELIDEIERPKGAKIKSIKT